MTGEAWEAELRFAERAVDRMEAVMGRLGPYEPVTPMLSAVFCAPLPPIDGAGLSSEQRARLGVLIQRMDAVRFELSARQKRVGGRLQAVSASLGRGVAPAVHMDQAL